LSSSVPSSTGNGYLPDWYLKEKLNCSASEVNLYQPLIDALSSDNLEEVKRLIALGANVNAECCSAERRYQIPLTLAMKKNDREAVIDFIKKGSVLVYEGNAGDIDCLNWAINKNYEDVVALLIEQHKAPLNDTFEGQTPLCRAIEKRSARIAKLLIEAGASLKRISLDCDSSSSHSPLILAINAKLEDIALLLIEKNVNLEAKDYDDKKPLHLAIENGSTTIALSLILKGAKLNVRTKKDVTPLQIAAELGNIEIVRLLIEREVPLNILLNYETTPLHRAIRGGFDDIAILLIESNARPNVQDREFATPLDIAIEKENDKIATLLISKGASVNTAKEGSLLPPFAMALKGNTELLKFTLETSRVFFGNLPLDEKAEPLSALLIELSEYDNHRNKRDIIYTICRSLKSDRSDTDREFSTAVLEMAVEKEKASMCIRKESSSACRIAICSYLIGMMGIKKATLEEIAPLIDTLVNHVDLRNDDHYELVLSITYKLQQIEKEKGFAILKKLIESFNIPKKGFKAFSLAQALLNLSEYDLLHAIQGLIDTQESPATFLETAFINSLKKSKAPEEIDLSGVENLEEKLHSILKSRKKFRQIEGVFLCLDRIRTLFMFQLGEEKNTILKALSIYLRDILDGKFIENRYDLEKSLHLKTVFGGDDSGKALLEKWKENEISPSEENLPGYTVCNTDDPSDILATEHDMKDLLEIHLMYSPDFSKSPLPTPLIDGKYRLIAVKNEVGKIVAMCYLLVLWDEKKSAPVLFQEAVRINPSEDNDHCTALMDKMCEKKASEMNLRLLRAYRKKQQGTQYTNPVKSLEGRASFKYWTSLGGEVNTNIYKIDYPTTVYRPKTTEFIL
jgi:ankyrin repeat protein